MGLLPLQGSPVWHWNTTPLLIDRKRNFVSHESRAMTAAVIMENANWDPGKYSFIFLVYFIYNDSDWGFIRHVYSQPKVSFDQNLNSFGYNKYLKHDTNIAGKLIKISRKKIFDFFFSYQMNSLIYSLLIAFLYLMIFG